MTDTFQVFLLEIYFYLTQLSEKGWNPGTIYK